MSERFPGVRIATADGSMFSGTGLGLIIRFFMHRSHAGIAPSVMRALDTYRRAVGPDTLAWYPDAEGDWRRLDDSAWERTRQALLDTGPHTFATLVDRPQGAAGFRFEYEGISLEEPSLFDDPRRACVASFWLPSTFLEESGPEHTRGLALELAAHLPFNSGYATLSFDTMRDEVGIRRSIRSMCFRYLGVDMLDHPVSWDIGTRIAGSYWLTFLGQPVLGELGGAEGLRARLTAPDTTVQQLPGDRAVVTLGQWPEAGDVEAGENLPAYRELARVMEPWLYHDAGTRFDPDFPPEDKRRWERRFLD
ncbi:type VI immunity family protein [Pyxidicoccus caerfyrddinensis]|uniref:type VI immunity family protein n=1 Tax=Pyxidicoccus caerfyrddinensis TaxID=2709663 RepID=UPI0013D9A064|nr:type VI immunity family protein [Pyxidicoccus caerfyrddinensis]